MLAIEKWHQTLLNEQQVIKEGDPTYDLRIYETFFIVSISNDKGGEMQEVQTEIRAIPKVTIVRTVGVSKNLGQRTLAKISVKFALLGQESRVRYRDKVLIPQMSLIKGLQIHKGFRIHRINVQGTIRKVRESVRLDEYAINDYAQFAYPGSSTRKMPTPRGSIQDLVDDYVSSGQQPYDVPVNTNNLAYHVMYPVEELKKYVPNKYYRGDAHKYDSSYRDFIANGPKVPVFLAIGQNGRVRVTGNEDIIMFAEEAGQEEVPVFLSYQRQV